MLQVSEGGEGARFQGLSHIFHCFMRWPGCLHWRCCHVCLPSICSGGLVLRAMDADETFGSHVGFQSSLSPPLSLSFLSLSFLLHVSHFNAELIQSGWAVQEQPSGSALLRRARQEVARTAACNSTWDFVWVTYIMAPFTVALTALFLFLFPFTFCLTSNAGERLNTLTPILQSRASTFGVSSFGFFVWYSFT